MIIVGIKRWAMIVGVASAASSGFGIFVALKKPAPLPPPPPKVCNDAIGFLREGMIVNCNGGEIGSLVENGQHAYYLCTCPRK